MNLKSDKILKDRAKNIFYQKGAGIADLSGENVLDYCVAALPELYTELKEEYGGDFSNLIIDFENHFTGIENLYKPALETVIINRTVNTIQEKTFLSFFIITQIIRHPNQWSELAAFFHRSKRTKFEMLNETKQLLSNRDTLMELIMPFAFSKWKLYRAKDMIYPLSDNSVLARQNHIYLPLAPDLLLEIDLSLQVRRFVHITKKFHPHSTKSLKGEQ